ncbi:MAG: 2-isopropylmalate synthase, partial [Coriobacteriia bacterium]|nr:2-isopropylmalate synthase [Coriobacteriia bacterium]
TGNGSLDAVQAAIRAVCPDLVYTFEDYEQHALEEESNARAASYVRLSDADGKPIWGVGIHCDITTASVNALLSAVNRVMQESEVSA